MIDAHSGSMDMDMLCSWGSDGGWLHLGLRVIQAAHQIHGEGWLQSRLDAHEVWLDTARRPLVLRDGGALYPVQRNPLYDHTGMD